MKSTDFVKKLIDITENYKTVYANGMFGQPITKSIIEQKANQLPNWYNKSNRKESLYNLVGQGYFGFDCVCLIKAVLWGWNGDLTKTNGGAVYGSNNVPDINADQMIESCIDVSTDFSNIQVGEVVWISGHIGVYVGDGTVIECTPKWENRVQYTAVVNLGFERGKARFWTKHGKLPYIQYETAKNEATDSKNETTKENINKGVVTVNLSTLRKGTKSKEVKAMQILLIGYGFSCGGCGADGSFGGATFTALKNYQKAKGLEVDGICGLKTWSSLLGG